MDLRVTPVDDAEAGDHHCELPAGLVDDHDVLERSLASARNAPTDEWVTAETDRDTAESLLAALRDACGDTDGVYRFDGADYRIRVETEDGETLAPASASSEAIRGAHAEDDP